MQSLEAAFLLENCREDFVEICVSAQVWKNGWHLLQKSYGHSHAIPQTCFCDYHAVEFLRKGAGADIPREEAVMIRFGTSEYSMRKSSCLAILRTTEYPNHTRVYRKIINSLHFEY